MRELAALGLPAGPGAEYDAAPIADADLPKIPFYHPGETSSEVKYLKARRAKLGGPLPSRHPVSPRPAAAPPPAFPLP